MLAAAVCGNGKQSLPLAQELSKKFPEGTLIQDVYLPSAKAFQAATRWKGATLTQASPPFYAQAQLGLARAYAMGGDKANAKKAYQDFFVTWKDADPGLPMLVAAKKELAAF